MAREFDFSFENADIPELSARVLRESMPDVTDGQADAFIKYYKMLVMWNRAVNLTRITDPVEVAQKHFADSVLGAALIPEGARVVDVGTGAGFPGVPLKIVRPDIELVMVDSLGKRVKFLTELTGALGVEATAIHARAEDAARTSELRGAFDIALSRAVAPMNVLIELTVPFVKIGGASLMYKGSNAREELKESANAMKTLLCRADAVDYDVPWGARTIVRAVKTAPTPAKYPRKAGVVERSPL